MNELQVFSQDIIPVYVTDTGEKVVLGRELHERLKISSKYADWFKNMCAYGFSENTDYSAFSKNLESGGRTIEHVLKLDMAKHIAMIQRSPQGKAIRDKLIDLDTNVASLSPELRLLINMELKQKEQARALAETNKRIDGIRDVVSVNPNVWREETRRLVSRIAKARGGMGAYAEVHAEIYDAVDERAGSCLETRLTNLRRRMAEEGVCKSKRDKVSKIDVIAADKRLTEIYIAVVKDMALKYQAWEGKTA